MKELELILKLHDSYNDYIKKARINNTQREKLANEIRRLKCIIVMSQENEIKNVDFLEADKKLRDVKEFIYGL